MTSNNQTHPVFIIWILMTTNLCSLPYLFGPSRTLPPPHDPTFQLDPKGESPHFSGFSITYQTPSTAPYTFPMDKFWTEWTIDTSMYHRLQSIRANFRCTVDHEGRLLEIYDYNTYVTAFFDRVHSLSINFERNYPRLAFLLSLSLLLFSNFIWIVQLIPNSRNEYAKPSVSKSQDLGHNNYIDSSFQKHQALQPRRDLLEHFRNVMLKQKLGNSRYIFFYGKPEKCSFL